MYKLIKTSKEVSRGVCWDIDGVTKSGDTFNVIWTMIDNQIIKSWNR